MTEQRTLYFSSKAAVVVTISSPNLQQPKKAHRVMAQIAAWKGVERLRAQWRTSKCLIEMGAQRGQLNPFVIAKPRSMVNGMPCTNSREPRMDCVPGLLSFVLSNKGAKEGIRSRHMCLLVDSPCVTKLGEMQCAGSICAFCIRCICVTDSHHCTFDLFRWKRGSKMLPVMSSIWCIPGK